jgi:hypothetical protein
VSPLGGFWAWRPEVPPSERPTQRPPAFTPAVLCECGVDAANVGGLHSDWCPKKTTEKDYAHAP